MIILMNSKKTALITGVNGMDGSHLADFLLNKGYIVYGMERRSSVKNRINTKHLESNNHFHFVIGDMSDSESLRNVVYLSNPDVSIDFLILRVTTHTRFIFFHFL